MNKSATSSSVFQRYPRLILACILGGLILFLLSLAELYLDRINQNRLDQSGLQRFVVLKEGIPDQKQSLRDLPLSADFNPTNYDNTFSADQNGFILPSYQEKGAEFSVVFMGDAAVAGLSLNGEDRLHYQVGQLLSKKVNKSISSFNAAYPGSDVVDITNRLVTNILPLRPKVVVLMSSVNDLAILSRNQSYWQDIQNPKVNTFRNHENSVLQLLSLSEIRKSLMVEKSNKHHSSKFILQDTTRIYTHYRNAITSLIRICKDWKVTPIFLSQSVQSQCIDLLEQINSVGSINLTQEEYSLMLYQMNEILKETALREGVMFLDLNRQIRNQSNYFQDCFQLNEKGTQSAAAMISEAINLAK